ncbi:MAG: lytic transglycosylase domain-containing protein [Acidimicrobiales bacterium]
MRRLALLVVLLPFLALLPIVAVSTGMGVWEEASASSTSGTTGSTGTSGTTGTTGTTGPNGTTGTGVAPMTPPAAVATPGSAQGTVADVPPAMLGIYRSAETICPGLSWTVLAGIGTVESSNGTSDLPGVHSGANFAGAEGPMQFEPATFAAYEYPVPPGGTNPPSPYDPVDAVYAAARDLCANGGGSPSGLPGAIFAYNHADWYVSEVLGLAQSYAATAKNSSLHQ